jgi:hypothetical protein
VPPHPRDIRGLEIDLAGTGALGFDGPTGVSGLLQGAFIYRLPFPLALSAYGTVGAGTASFDPGNRNTGPVGGDIQVATGELLVSLDSRYVAFGIGVGAALMDDGDDVEPLVVFRGRFGEIDQFEVTWHVAFATGGTTAAGVFGGALEFRVAPTWWAGADAELGNERYGRFMLDLRHRLKGDGHHNTVDLRLGRGRAVVHSTPSCTTSTTSTDVECLGTNVDYLGPGASIGLVWRP